MAYYSALIAKWPSVTGATTQAKLDNLNGQTLAVGTPKPLIVSTYEIYNCIVASEFDALTATQQQQIRDILSMGTVDASPGTNVRARILAVFGVGSQTRTNLTNLATSFDTPSIPWWEATVAQGGGGLNGPVSANDLVAAGGLS